MHPLVYGDYPSSIKKNSGSKVPAFTKLQSKQVKSSFDFIGINHYYIVTIRNRDSNLDVENRDIIVGAAIGLACMSPDLIL